MPLLVLVYTTITTLLVMTIIIVLWMMFVMKGFVLLVVLRIVTMAMSVPMIIVALVLEFVYTLTTMLLAQMTMHAQLMTNAVKESVYLVMPRIATIIMIVPMILATYMVIAHTRTTRLLVMITMLVQLMMCVVMGLVFLELLRIALTTTAVLTIPAILILVFVCIPTIMHLAQMAMPVPLMTCAPKEHASRVILRIVTIIIFVPMIRATSLVIAYTRTTRLLALITMLVRQMINVTKDPVFPVLPRIVMMVTSVPMTVVILILVIVCILTITLLARMTMDVPCMIHAMKENVSLDMSRIVTIMMYVPMILATLITVVACTLTIVHRAPITMLVQLMMYVVKEFVFPVLRKFVTTAMCVLTIVVTLILVLVYTLTTMLLATMVMLVPCMIHAVKEHVSLVAPRIVMITTYVPMTPAIHTLVIACTRTTQLLATITMPVL